MRALTRRTTLLATASLAFAAPPRKPHAEPAPGQLQLTDPTPLPPTLSWTDAQGAPRRVADYPGQGIVLNLWATWCAPCIAEMPALATLATRLSGKRIAVIPICTDATGSKAAQSFYAAHAITSLSVYLDPSQHAYDTLAIEGLPTTLIIDRKGRQVARVEGAADWAAAAPQIQALCDSA